MMLTQCQKEAKELFKDLHPSERIVFDMVDVEGKKISCFWIDPDKGTFKFPGTSGFSEVNDFLGRDPNVEDMKIEYKK